MDIVKLVLTSLLSIAALFIITKIMGHKQVAQLDFFDYVSGITIGSIAAELATDLENAWQPLIALALYGVVSVVLNLCASKIQRTRKYINGAPTILMNGGKIYRENLKQAKLDLSEFMLLCREQGFFDLDEIETAVFEHNGKLSILPKGSFRPVTPSDLNLKVKESHIGTEVIMDGQILGENLSRMGYDEIWLARRLEEEGYKKAEDIFLGIFRINENKLSLYPK